MKRLFIAWQDPSSRYWFPIGRLTVQEKKYVFQYINGANEAIENGGFEPFQVFPMLDATYESDTLFPFFAKRTLSPSRPEYADFISWLGLSGPEIDPIELLSRSGGKTATDRFEIFPFPERMTDNKYHTHFFVHGLRHLPEKTIERIDVLKAGETLYLANEFQNLHDHRAMALCTEDHWLVGYCPRYLLHDVEDIAADPKKIVITVEKDVTTTTPLQFRLLCGLTAAWKKSELPFNKERYQPIEENQARSADFRQQGLLFC